MKWRNFFMSLIFKVISHIKLSSIAIIFFCWSVDQAGTLSLRGPAQYLHSEGDSPSCAGWTRGVPRRHNVGFLNRQFGNWVLKSAVRQLAQFILSLRALPANFWWRDKNSYKKSRPFFLKLNLMKQPRNNHKRTMVVDFLLFRIR